MNRVLVVADNEAVRDTLALALFEEGHRVKTASGAREAVNCGCRFRPGVVVSSWRLDRNLTGLDVADAVRGMVPGLQTILFTAYPSEDMDHQARRRGVFRFFSGPLDPDGLRRAVRDALARPDPVESGSRVPILEVDTNRTIVYANEPARMLLASTEAGKACDRFDEHFRETVDLDAAQNGWIEVRPSTGPDRTPWFLTAQREPGDSTSLVLFHAASDRLLRTTPIVRALLGTQPSATARLLHPYHILIVDDDAFVRRTTAASLASAGAFCHTAANHEEARRLYAADPEIQIVLLDHDMPEGPPHDLVTHLRHIRPEVVIIANSGRDRRAEFAAMGVRQYLTKPWSLEEFLDQIQV